MFHSIPESIRARMVHLEQIDVQDRIDGTPRLQRLRQVPAETGKFIALLAAGAPAGGDMLEIGTSAGYSTLWIAMACEQTGRRVTTFEILPAKAVIARETFRLAQVEGVVNFVEGDARNAISGFEAISFCFLDAEKEIYAECYAAIVPRLVKGGLLVADNAINHQEALHSMLEMALADPRVDAMIVPIGKGELVCRKI